MQFERLAAHYITPAMKQAFSLGDVDGMPRVIGPERDMIVLHATTRDGIQAWSAIDTTKMPVYSSESTVESWALLPETGQRFVGNDFQTAREAVRSLGYLIDHRMYEAAFANLFIDADAQMQGIPLASYLGGTKDTVEVGVSVPKNAPFSQIRRHIEEDHFHRIKIKVGPTQSDLQKITEVKHEFPTMQLMVDANSSFLFHDKEHRNLLRAYGELGLLMIEQPLGHNDIADHIKLQELFLRERIPGRVCLDESIHTLEDAKHAIDGGIPIINVKVTRVGGLDVARDIIESSMPHHVDTWIGGNVELTAPGKAHALAMASHPGVTLPSDISGTDAYFLPGIDPCITPMQREPGGAYITVPRVVGRGYDVDIDKLRAVTKETIIFEAR